MARPRKSESLRVRERAIEVTMSLLSEEDIQSLTMGKVAEAIGCKAPALYNHYRNKEALLNAVHDAAFDKLYREKMAVATAPYTCAVDRLRAGGKAYLCFALENPALYRLMFSRPPSGVQADNPFRKDRGAKSLEVLADNIRECQAVGAVKAFDVDTLAYVLWSAVHGAAELFLQSRAPIAWRDHETLIDATVDALMQLVLTDDYSRKQGAPFQSVLV